MTKLAFIHTSHVLIPMFSQLAAEIVPDFSVFHMTDESLIKNTIAQGTLTKATTRRLLTAIGSAHEAGADAVLVTCSSIGEGVATARTVFDFPVFRIDETMAEAAVEAGARIGVAATLRTTLEPTIRLLESTAAAKGREVRLVPSLSEGAFEAVIAGDIERHDRLLLESLNSMRPQVDVVVLAQASMARVAVHVQAGSAPIISSPALAVRRVRDVMMREAGNA